MARGEITMRVSPPPFSSDGRWFSVRSGNTVRLIDVKRQQQVRSYIVDGCPLGFREDNETLVVLANATAIREVHQVRVPRLRSDSGESPDHLEIVLLRTDSPTLRRIPLKSFPGNECRRATISDDGMWMALAMKGNGPWLVAIVHTDSGKSAWSINCDSAVNAIRFSPDGRKLAVATSDGTTIRSWSEDSAPAVKLPPATGQILFSSNGHRIYLPQWGGNTLLCDLDRTKPDITLPLQRPGEGRLSLSRDGRVLATGATGETFVWHIAARRTILRMQETQCILFSPDGRSLAIVGNGYQPWVSLVNLPTIEEIDEVQPRRFDSLADVFFENAGIPVREAETPRACLDLSASYMAGLDYGWHGTDRNNSLIELPKGAQQFGGTVFDARGVVLPGRGEGTAIPVKRSCQSIQFLYSADAVKGDEGVSLGCFRILYADGQEVELPLLVGSSIADWWTAPQTLQLQKNVMVAWTGWSPSSRISDTRIHLLKLTWANLRPEVEIKEIRFISDAGLGEPFLVAVTTDP